ncbi:MAG: PAS-domain containing protein [Rhodospirillales bacterium]|nr:PAS-domain containing protein [Rhodospirillales bacterium]
MDIDSTYILPISIGLQLAAAFLAFRLIRSASGGAAWAFIALAFFLMSVHRSIDYYKILENGANQPSSNADLVTLLISMLMVAGVILIGPALSATRQTEHKLRQSERHAESIEDILHDAIENISEGFVIFDADGKLVICNNRYKEFYGYSDKDTQPGVHTSELGRLDLERGTVNFEGKAEDYVERRDSSHQLRDSLIVNLTDGRIIETRDRKTTTGGIVSFQQDVTEREQTLQALQQAHDELEHRVEERTRALSKEVAERKRAEEMAEIASHAKSDLMANMSHELRTPLNAIIGFSSTIMEETFGPIDNKKYSEYMDDIHQSGQHLLELINDILDVSAIEAGAMDIHEETVSLSTIVDASIRIIMPRANKGRLTITASIKPENLQIVVDPRRLKQVLLNLLSNADKFTPENGEVSVTALLNNDDGSLSITIADTGIGMDEKEMKIALSTFGQVDSGLDRKHEGTGLGLPLTKELMKLHGGMLKVKSKLGHGTAVTVILPKERVVLNS